MEKFFDYFKEGHWKEEARKIRIKKSKLSFIELDDFDKLSWEKALVKSLAANRVGIPFVMIDKKNSKSSKKILKEKCENLKIFKDVCSIYFTSGSTGEPKPIQCTNKMFINSRKYEERVYSINTKENIGTMLPLSFKRGYLFFLLAGFTGASFTFMDRSESYEDVVEQIVEKKITFFSAIPHQWNCICEVLEKKDINLNITAAYHSSNISSRTLGVLKKRTNRVGVNYGATEFGATYYIHFDKNKKINSKKAKNCVGKPDENKCIVNIVDKKGKKCKTGESGEVIIRGENLSPSCGKVYKTGDFGHKDGDGDLFIEGRMDEQIKVMGVRTNCAQFENNYSKYNCFCFPVSSETKGWSEVICVFETKDDISKVRDYVKKAKNPINVLYKPFFIHAVEKFPLTSTGKIDKQKIKKITLKEIQKNNNTRTTITKTEKDILKICKKLIGRNKLGIKDSLFNNGLNSLKLFELHSEIEKKFPGKILISDLFILKNVEEISGYLEKNNSYDKTKQKI